MCFLDQSAVDSILGGMPASVISIVLQNFEADVRHLTRDVVRASNTNDSAALIKASHALAEVAIQLGALELARLARMACLHLEPSEQLPIVSAGETAIDEIRKRYAHS